MKKRISLFVIAFLLIAYYCITRPELSKSGQRDLLNTRLSLDSTFDESREIGNINLERLSNALAKVPGYDTLGINHANDATVTFKRPLKNFDDEDFRRLFFNRLSTDDIVKLYKKMPVKINATGNEIVSFTVKAVTKGGIRYVYLPFDVLASISRRVREQKDNIAP